MTDEESTRIGHAIRDAANLVALPIENDRELNAICIKMAIESRFNNDAQDIIEVATLYRNFITMSVRAR